MNNLEILRLLGRGKITRALASSAQTGWELSHDWLSLRDCARNSGVAYKRLYSFLQTKVGEYCIPRLACEDVIIVYVPALSIWYDDVCFYEKDEQE
jgi:hypothetical protein